MLVLQLVFATHHGKQAMKHHLLKILACAAFLAAGGHAQAGDSAVLRVLVHSSFELPKPLLEQFEAQHAVKLSIIKAGDAGEMLNKLILTKASPIADLVYGIDNSLALKALKAQVISPYAGNAAKRPSLASLPAGLVPVDLGYVTINVDKAAFAKTGLALPTRLEELTLPAYKGLLAVQNPATSSTGNAFLLSTIAGLGEGAAFQWWAKMRANGLQVSKGWSETYYTDFSRSGGKYPLVVSYASSPAADLFYSKLASKQALTLSLNLKGAVYQQVEGVALIKGGANTGAAGHFIEFLRSPAVQAALQTTMWMLPAVPGVALDAAMVFAPSPPSHDTPSAAVIAAKNSAWVSQWTKVVLK